MSHRNAPCAGFDSEAEKVPDRQGESEIWAVLAESAQRELQPQIVWHSPAIWLQDKGGWL